MNDPDPNRRLIIAFGDAKIGSSFQSRQSAPVKKLLRELQINIKRRGKFPADHPIPEYRNKPKVVLLFVHEPFTSQKSSCCHEQTEAYRDRGHPIKKCLHCGIIWNRDVNAAR